MRGNRHADRQIDQMRTIDVMFLYNYERIEEGNKQAKSSKMSLSKYLK